MASIEKIWKISSCSSIFISLTSLFVMRQISKSYKTFSNRLRVLGQSEISDLPGLSVLVPVRNEEITILESLKSVLEQDYNQFEVIAIDDSSTDHSYRQVKQLAEKYPDRLRLIEAKPPTDDWTGKNNALWQGFLKVKPTSKWLLFIDADTKLSPRIIKAAVNYAKSEGLDLLSLVPRMRLESFWSRLLTPEIGKLYVLSANNPLRFGHRNAGSGASAVGPFILVRREAYRATNGHLAIRNSVLDDVDLARNFRASGFSTWQGAGMDYVERNWYTTLPEIWQGVSKNLFLVAEKNWLAIGFILLTQVFYGLLPLLTFFRQFSKLMDKKASRNRSRSGFILSGVALLLTLGAYGETYRSMGLSRLYALLYPVVVVLTSVLALDSAIRLSLGRSVGWKGRNMPTDTSEAA